MRISWIHITALALCVCMPPAEAYADEFPYVKSFSFVRSGTNTEQVRSYRIADINGGRFAQIELFYSYYIVLPMTDDDMAAFSAMVSELSIDDWNGFSETDPDVIDGESFSLHIELTDGRTISVDGFNCFPANYFEDSMHIEAFFRALMEIYEIDVD